MESFEFTSTLWRWEAQESAAWFFVTVPADASDDLRMEAGPPRGFGSVRVEARIGATVWRTSVFPQKETGSFVLPVKKPVRLAERLDEGTVCAVSLRVVEG